LRRRLDEHFAHPHGGNAAERRRECHRVDTLGHCHLLDVEL
jgi:hypothetical protein